MGNVSLSSGREQVSCLSFCARHLGVQGVVSSDREPVLIENMRECVRFNHQGKDSFSFYPAVWDWGTPLEKTEELGSFVEGDGLRFDVALGADLVCLSLFLDNSLSAG